MQMQCSAVHGEVFTETRKERERVDRPIYDSFRTDRLIEQLFHAKTSTESKPATEQGAAVAELSQVDAGPDSTPVCSATDEAHDD